MEWSSADQRPELSRFSVRLSRLPTYVFGNSGFQRKSTKNFSHVLVQFQWNQSNGIKIYQDLWELHWIQSNQVYFRRKKVFADHNWYCADRIPCFRALRLFRYFAKLNQYRNIMHRTFENWMNENFKGWNCCSIGTNWGWIDCLQLHSISLQLNGFWQVWIKSFVVDLNLYGFSWKYFALKKIFWVWIELIEWSVCGGWPPKCPWTQIGYDVSDHLQHLHNDNNGNHCHHCHHCHTNIINYITAIILAPPSDHEN